jgi:hypothetical protein
MASKFKKISIAGMTYALLFAGAGSKITGSDGDDICGGDARWAVKVLTDEDAGSIQTKPIEVSIADLNAENRDGIKIGRNTIRQEQEMQVYTIKNCTISKAILEDDNDIHLVLEQDKNHSPDGKHHTMVAEIPDPDCPDVQESRWFNKIAKARATFMKYKDNYWSTTFTITGVFFFDQVHNGTGHGPNHAELHPVLILKPDKK